MTFAIAELQQHGALIETGTTGMSIVHAGGRIGPFPHPRDPSHLEIPSAISTPRPSWAAQQYVKALVSFSATAKAIAANDELTDVAKERRMAPFRESARKTIAAIDEDFAGHQKQVGEVEVHRYSVPRLTNGDVIKQLEGMEIRQRIPTLSQQERTALMDTLNQGEEEDAVLLEAVLRGPLARVGALEQVARAGWTKLVDRRDPVGLEILQNAKADIAWAERVIAMTKHPLLKAIGG